MTHDKSIAAVLILIVTLIAWGRQVAADGPYQATGFKVGEVTDSTAIVWTRVTRHEQRNPSDAPMVEFRTADGKESGEIVAIEFPDGLSVFDIRNAVPGSAGEVRVLYRPTGNTEWRAECWIRHL